VLPIGAGLDAGIGPHVDYAARCSGRRCTRSRSRTSLSWWL
jgi:hypothetical protein